MCYSWDMKKLLIVLGFIAYAVLFIALAHIAVMS